MSLTNSQSPAGRNIEDTSLLLQASSLSCIKGERLLFKNIDIEIGREELLELRGPNGCGKTSLLRLLAGLSPPQSGHIRYRGLDIETHREAYVREMAYIAHNNGIKLALSPLENLRFSRALLSSPNAIEPEMALKSVGLEQYTDVPVSNLSAGQRRRVALARLLLTTASLWLLDEPLASLDEEHKSRVSELIVSHVGNGGAVILTSHENTDWQGVRVKTRQLA